MHPSSAYTRKASNLSYQKILQSGRLAESRRMVYEYLYMNGPANQLTTYDDISKVHTDIAWSTVTGAFSDLAEMGLVEVIDDSVINRRGSKVTLWDVTGASEVKPLAKPKVSAKVRAEKLTRVLQSFVVPFLNKTGHAAEAQKILEWIEAINNGTL